MVVHCPEPVCRAQELGCYLQGQGHKGLYNHNVTVSTTSIDAIFSELIKKKENYQILFVGRPP